MDDQNLHGILLSLYTVYKETAENGYSRDGTFTINNTDIILLN
jgi:hypothetical protein